MTLASAMDSSVDRMAWPDTRKAWGARDRSDVDCLRRRALTVAHPHPGALSVHGYTTTVHTHDCLRVTVTPSESRSQVQRTTAKTSRRVFAMLMQPCAVALPSKLQQAWDTGNDDTTGTTATFSMCPSNVALSGPSSGARCSHPTMACAFMAKLQRRFGSAPEGPFQSAPAETDRVLALHQK